jgi:hypothetical protein
MLLFNYEDNLHIKNHLKKLNINYLIDQIHYYLHINYKITNMKLQISQYIILKIQV